mmetsp:Transcript_13541/g.25416  ORF Transcript_13541/g.25416 Transcript_13541/m.25416 type:complete len:773 (+) Transcript_13541:129-2447(+)
MLSSSSFNFPIMRKQSQSHDTSLKMNLNSNNDDGKIESRNGSNKSPAAQTASVGDREMMTYMKLSIPSPSLEASGVSGNNTDSEDARFLDGLFERLSGSSDNGSDKGKDDSSGGSGGGNVTTNGDHHENSSSSKTSSASYLARRAVTSPVREIRVPDMPFSVSVSSGSTHRPSSAVADADADANVVATKHQNSTNDASFRLSSPSARRRLTSEVSSMTTSSSSLPHGTNKQQTQLPQHHLIFTKSQDGNNSTDYMNTNPSRIDNESVHSSTFLSHPSSLTTSLLSQSLPFKSHPAAASSSSNNLLSPLISNDLLHHHHRHHPKMSSHSTLTQAHHFPSWMMTTTMAAARSNQNVVPPLSATACVSSSMSSQAVDKQHSLSLHTFEQNNTDEKVLSRDTGQGMSDSVGSPTTQGLGFSQQHQQEEGGMPSHMRRKRKQASSSTNDMRHYTTTGRQNNDGHLMSMSSSKNKRDFVSSISEDEDDQEKRRKDRNMREQERSQRITHQITELKALLAASNVPFKPDKYSTLVSVHCYIKTLQQRAALLDEEQRKLVDTITQSNELVQKSQHGLHALGNPQAFSPAAHQTASGHSVIPYSHVHKTEDDEILGLVRGLDYKNVFSKIRIALCVTSIDGRLIDCNDEFARVCGLTWISLVSAGLREPQNESELEYVGTNPISLFNLIAREDMQKVFEAMSAMLKNVSNPEIGFHDQEGLAASREDYTLQSHPSNLKTDHWSSDIRHCQSPSTKLQLNISLVRNKNGSPRFFNCALTTVE